jgi:hypothetical protein
MVRATGRVVGNSVTPTRGPGCLGGSRLCAIVMTRPLGDGTSVGDAVGHGPSDLETD